MTWNVKTQVGTKVAGLVYFSEYPDDRAFTGTVNRKGAVRFGLHQTLEKDGFNSVWKGKLVGDHLEGRQVVYEHGGGTIFGIGSGSIYTRGHFSVTRIT